MNDTSYAAIISISLPGMKNAASTHIRLTPSDAVETEGKKKLLQDCTLADIRSFASQLEAEVWDAYHSIRLVELATGQGTKVEVTTRDAQDNPVVLKDWKQQVVLLSTSGVVSAEDPVDAPSTLQGAGAVQEQLDPAAVPPRERDLGAATSASEAEPELEPSTDASTVPDEALSRVMVLESEPVYAEREATDDPNAFPTPAIAPSQARVRIAGRRQPIGQGSWAAVDILMDEPALRATQAHALSSLNREVAGVLLGPRPEKQPDGRYVVHVIDSIIAKHTLMQGASVTYTAESWRYVNDSLYERYPDETVVIVGWYHTHPGFGIFLSGMDQFIHQNFFTQIWHTALVLDPIARRSGFFCWDLGQTRVSRYDFSWPDWAKSSW